MPDRNIRLKLFIDAAGLKELANFTLLLQKAAAAEKALTGQALKKNKVLKKQTGVVKKDSKALDDVNKKTRTWTAQIAKNIGKVLEWTVATGLVFGSIQALRTGIDDLVGVEFAMAGLTKVMRDGETRAKSLKGELLKLGQQYGELGEEVIDASTEWARLQLSTFEIAENARTALLGQAVAELEIVQATKFLIAGMQQFDQTSLANIRTLDMWNELSNQMAVRALDLAQATARAGSVIHNAGDDMAFLNGMTAALVQSTGRSGQEIGNAIRTFGTYAFRLRSIGTIQRETGIIIQNSVGQHRSFSDIISELALRWDTFTDATQRSIAQSVAGTRRQNEFITLMKEFPEVLQATQIAWDSLGSAQKEANIFLDTAQKKADRLRAGMQRLVSTYGDNLLPGMKAVLDGLNNLINALIEAREIVILFSGAIAILGVKALITSGVMLKLAGAIKTLVFGASLLNPWLIALAAAATVGGIAWRAMRKEITNTSGALIESLQGSRNQVKSLEQQGDTLEWLAERYVILRDAQKGASSAAEAEKINDALQEIARSIQVVTKSVGLETVVNTDKWAESLDRVEKIIQGIRRAQEGNRQQAVRNAQTISNNTRLAIDFGKEFIKLMRLGNNANDSFDRAAKKVGVSTGSLKATLQGTGLVAERLGTTIPVSMAEAKEAIQNLEAVLNEARNIMKELRIPDEFFGSLAQAVLSAEEFRNVMADIGRLNRQLDRDASHAASMAQVAGKHRLRSMEAEREGLITNIASLEQQRAAHNLGAKQFQDFTKLIDRRKEKLDGLNKAIELGVKQAHTSGLRSALKVQLDIERDRFEIEKDFARARKDNVGVQRLHIEQLKAEQEAYKEVFFEAIAAGLATDEYFNGIVALDSEIEIQTALLNNSIIPQERLKELTEKRKAAERNLTAAISDQNAETERQIAILRASGATDEEIARIKVANAQTIIALSKKFIPAIETEKKLTDELRDAYNELNAAILSRNFADIESSILSIGQQTSRQIDLAKAWGATGVQAAEMRIAGLEREREAIVQSSMTFRQRFSAMLSLSKRMMDATHELAVADATAAKESADAWIKEYERRQKAWAKIIGKGLSRKSITETFERIQQEMVDRWVRTALDPVIKALTDWEFTMLGIDPKQLQLQQENQRKMTAALVAGGASVQKSIIDGANYHARAVRAAVQGTPVPTINVPGAGTQGLPSDFIGPPPPPGGVSPGVGGTALSLLPFAASNIQDFTTARGGGVRAAGSIAGAGIGMAFGIPAPIGAQIGLQLTSTIQDLKHWLEGKDDELKRPESESLREQFGSAINRGTFGNAASIVYNTEVNVNMGFMLPEREGMRKAAAALKRELSNINANVSVEA